MIKAKANGINGPLYIFGLSDGNIERLREGKPIVFDMSSVGGRAGETVCIMWGKTEADMKAELAENFQLGRAEPI
jgi:hypothetical protein